MSRRGSILQWFNGSNLSSDNFLFIYLIRPTVFVFLLFLLPHNRTVGGGSRFVKGGKGRSRRLLNSSINFSLFFWYILSISALHYKRRIFRWVSLFIIYTLLTLFLSLFFPSFFPNSFIHFSASEDLDVSSRLIKKNFF